MIVGYTFGLPQVAVPEMDMGLRNDLGRTFYEMSRQVFPNKQGEGIGSAMRKRLMEIAQDDGFQRFATHQNDIFTEKALNDEVQLLYGFSRARVAFLRGALPGHGGPSQQYVIFDMAQKNVEKRTDDLGGIDIQNIDVAYKNGSVKIQFNDHVVRDALKHGFSGFTPVILNVTPVESPLLN